MTSSNAEDLALIGDNSTTEFRNIEICTEDYLALLHFLHFEEMYVSGTPFEVMHEF